jgi:hypothetical protein
LLLPRAEAQFVGHRGDRLPQFQNIKMHITTYTDSCSLVTAVCLSAETQSLLLCLHKVPSTERIELYRLPSGA